MYKPTIEITKELLNAGATPFHYNQSHEWEDLFVNDTRVYMPQPLRCTLNIAALINDREIFDALIQAGEETNKHTAMFFEEESS